MPLALGARLDLASHLQTNVNKFALTSKTCKSREELELWHGDWYLRCLLNYG